MPHPFPPPMRVAEKVATVDILSGGRVEWGTGRSTPMEQTAFGVPKEESRAMWEEAIDAVVKMWESEYFEYHGKYLEFPRRMVTPKPVQDPHPPCWMAATTDGSAEVAGSLGLGMLSLSIMKPLDQLAQQVAQYRKAALSPTPLTRVTTNKVAAYTLVHCADTMADAEANGIWDSVWWLPEPGPLHAGVGVPPLLRGRAGGHVPAAQPARLGEFEPRDFNDADMIIVGAPEQCLEKLAKYNEIGVDSVICYMQFGYLPHEAILHGVELLGHQGGPELDKLGIVTPPPTDRRRPVRRPRRSVKKHHRPTNRPT